MLTYIWSIYWLSTYVMLIMMLNFIIAIMGQKYEEITSAREQVKLLQMTDMIEESLVHRTYELKYNPCYWVFDRFVPDKNIGFAVIFSKKREDVVDEFQGVTNTIKKQL